MTNRRPPPTWMVQVIYADGSFENRYLEAPTAADAIEMVKAETPLPQRRWARFVA